MRCPLLVYFQSLPGTESSSACACWVLELGSKPLKPLLQQHTTMLCLQVDPEGADCNRPAGDAEAGRELHISGYPDGAARLPHTSRCTHLFFLRWHPLPLRIRLLTCLFQSVIIQPSG